MSKHRMIGLLVIIALVVIIAEFLLNYRQPEVVTPSILPPSAPVVEVSPLPVAQPLVDGQAEDKKLIAVRYEQAWVMQVASYKDALPADALVEHLQAKAFDAFAYPIEVEGKSYVRVSVGPVATHEDAERLKADLLEKMKLAGFITPYEPSHEVAE